ncbi:acetyl-CoA carboxylase biotin carboxyl carrier protein [Lachnospiraceae bacterium AM48-27BH]|nr:acetyl-CoA carboxylase biotin carboxyl carrier protein [Lachnospiraceae bacterium AM48-27BH]
MEIQDILALVQAVADNGLTELKVDDGNVKLSLKKEHPVVNVVAGNTGAGAAGAEMQVAGVQMPDFGSFGAAGGAAQETGNAVANTGAAAKTAPINSDKIVVSPLVGTFYSSSSPEAESFVKVGDTVKKGQVLGIVEAMKLMNEIESEYDGVVEEVMVGNEEVVEYGQPLFRIH